MTLVTPWKKRGKGKPDFTFRVLVIEDPMWVHRVWAGSKVFQMDDKDILFFSLQDGAKEPQPRCFGDLLGVSVIGELPKNSLFVHTSYPVGSSCCIHACEPGVEKGKFERQ